MGMAGETADDMDVCAAAEPDAVVVVDEDDNTAATGGGGPPADAAVAAAGGVTAKAEGEAGEVEEEMVPPSVTASFLKEMIEMGFGEPRCTRALHFTDNASVEAAVQWLVEHGNDADIDEPLLVPKSKPKLTPEEAKRRADELLRKGKEKREREEKELEKLREKERIRFGKEMAAARKLEEEEEIKRNLKERMRQKKADAIAKDKIKQKLEEDRIARRLERGLPAEYTEEELKEIEERRKKEAEEAFKKRNVRAPLTFASSRTEHAGGHQCLLDNYNWLNYRTRACGAATDPGSCHREF